jgi:peptide/nickel transport system substrate-binding protein
VILGALSQADAIKRNLAKARAALAASGPGAHAVTLEYPSDVTINGVPFATLAQRVQANLGEAGFDIDLAGSPVATLQPKFRAGRIAFGLWLWGPDYPDPADYLVFTPGRLIALHVGWTKGSDPGVEKLAARAVAATAPAARRSLYRQIQRGLTRGARSCRSSSPPRLSCRQPIWRVRSSAARTTSTSRACPRRNSRRRGPPR